MVKLRALWDQYRRHAIEILAIVLCLVAWSRFAYVAVINTPPLRPFVIAKQSVVPYGSGETRLRYSCNGLTLVQDGDVALRWPCLDFAESNMHVGLGYLDL